MSHDHDHYFYFCYREGESSYLTEANKIRSDIIKLAETIDALRSTLLNLIILITFILLY